MRSSLAILWALPLAAMACSDASGTLNGGEPLSVSSASTDPCSSISGTPTWTALYQCYFSASSGKASCGGPSCHGNAGALGAASSGFVCGTTPASCWMGLTSPNSVAPLVPVGGAKDETTTAFWQALHSTDPAGVTDNNMPLNGYTFTAADLDRIRAWIQGGAPNN